MKNNDSTQVPHNIYVIDDTRLPAHCFDLLFLMLLAMNNLEVHLISVYIRVKAEPTAPLFCIDSLLASQSYKWKIERAWIQNF